jgi:hypothetical protein
LFKRILVALFLTAFAVPAFAGNIVNLDKSKVRLSIAPGQVKTGSILVENNSPEPKSVRIYTEDWVYIPPFDGSKDFQPAGTTRLSCAPWISYEPAELTLGPFAKQAVNYSVRVPEGIEGGRYAVLFFENYVGKPENEGVGVNVAVRMACLFYVEAEGGVKRQMSLGELAVKKDGQKPLQLSLKLTNTGNTDITCGGTFDIMDNTGMVFGRGDLNQAYMFPGDPGTLTGSWSLPLKKGIYSLVLTLDLGKALEEAGIGRGPTLVKETSLEIGASGEVVSVGELK